MSDKGVVTACPEGHVPLETKIKGEKHIAIFSETRCTALSESGRCPVVAEKKGTICAMIIKDFGSPKEGPMKKQKRLKIGIGGEQVLRHDVPV